MDEVGYGAWAGPVMACALKFCCENDVQCFDSKSISAKKREEIFEKLKLVAIWQLGIGTVEEINQFGLAYAHKMAILRALEGLSGSVFIDGRKPSYLECTAIIKGDQKIKEIAAASIIAKVSRDKLMCELGNQFSEYGFQNHKGYGTKAHIEAIRKYGFSPQHRIHYNLKRHFE